MRLAVHLLLATVLAIGAAAPPTLAGAEETAAARDERITRQTPRDVVLARGELQLAVQLHENGKAGAATEALDQAIAHDPGNPWLYLLQAEWRGLSPQAAASLGSALKASVTGFPNQLVLGFNLYLLLLWSLVFGFTAALGAVVYRCVPHANHRITETLAARIGRPARWFAPLLLLVPVLWGIGLISMAALYTTWFWPLLRGVEKRLGTGLIIGGFVLWLTHSVAPAPLHPPGDQHGPFQIASSFEAGGGPSFRPRVSFPEPAGYSSWALALNARRVGRNDVALRELEKAFDVLGDRAPLINDLGNAHFALGHRDEAKALYSRAAELDPGAAEPLYNYAQVLSEELDFINSDEIMKEALQINYPRLAEFRESGAFAKPHAAIDMLPGALPFWRATLVGEGTKGRAPLPTGLSILCPGGKIGYLPAGLVLMVALGLLGGIWLGRSVRTYGCASCRSIVCRRCLIRIEGRPYCEDCGQTMLADCSTQYSKALLDRYFKRRYTLHTVVGGILAWVLPGWREARAMKEKPAVLAMSLTGAALLLASMRGLPLVVDSGSVYSTPISFGWWTAIATLLYVIARLVTVGKTSAEEIVNEIEEELDPAPEEEEFLYVVGE